MRLTRSLFALALGACCAASAASALEGAGSYLAARHGSYASDFEQSANYYMRALAVDATNPDLMENAMVANVNLGQLERALPIARQAEKTGLESQAGALVLLAQQAKQEQYADIIADFDAGKSVGALVDGLVQAWAQFGTGDVQAALAKFDAVAAEKGLQSFALYHKALALASAGDFEGADDIFSGRAAGPLNVSPRGIAAHAQILSQLDRNQDALELISAAFGTMPAPVFDDMASRLEAGETLQFDLVTAPNDGMAEVFHSVATALSNEAQPGYTLMYGRIAEYLNPRNIDAILLNAALLEELEQFDLATRAYDRVPRDNPAFVVAEMGRAAALDEGGKPDAAIEVLSQLAKDYPDLLLAHVTLGDMYRRMDRFAEAIGPYDRAIALLETPEPQHWVVYFSRGIVLERTDRWDEAEADLRKALELQPDQPQVLNYLGYSLVEMQENLDEALDMIERAVAERPDDGYITDSLGWVQFRMGQYEDAVENLERATELMPVDAIINDHLGDAYWAVGRKVEARFQWRRALSFDPEEEDAARIRRKLEAGLDIVLAEEGAEPIAVAKDG